jgi:hypothetical protein
MRSRFDLFDSDGAISDVLPPQAHDVAVSMGQKSGLSF